MFHKLKFIIIALTKISSKDFDEIFCTKLTLLNANLFTKLHFNYVDTKHI